MIKRLNYLIIILLWFGSSYAQQKSIFNSSDQVNSSTNVDYTQVNINNILYWVRENGVSGNNAVSHGSGGIFPRGTAGIIFYDGIVWAGKVKDGDLPELRAGGSTYASGTVSGAILGERTGIAEDPDSPDVRIWRVRNDWASVDLKLETAEYFDIPMDSVTYSQIATVRTKYRDDWNEWPAEKGAPFYDLDKNGSYDPAIDIPGIANADQVVWFVANDLNDGAVRGFASSPSIGIEHQVTLWAYDRVGKLGNIIFKRSRIIYKGTAETPPTAFIENMYISQWADTDLGYWGDDLIGSDRSANVGFTYNSGDIDEDFESFGLPPPSMGYVLIQGPTVPSEGDEAIFDFRIRRDHKNLRMTSFSFPICRPCNTIETYGHTIRLYNFMQGLQHDGTPVLDPNTLDTTNFYASGDPITGSGWIDGTAVTPGDRRVMLSSGPFTMALGDTQEIVIAIVAGIGINRLEGFAEMKELARFSNSLSMNMFTDPLKVEMVISQPNSEEVEILVSAVTAANVERVITRVYNYNDEIEATFDLSISDNDGGDSLTWTMNWLTDQREYGMYANFYLISGGDTAVWEHQLDNITTLGPVEWNDLIILDDNVNNDGKINVGEKIIFSPLIENRSSMSIENAKISVLILDENIIEQGPRIAESVDTLFPGVNTLKDRYFALSLNTPVSDDLEVIVSIIDRSHNRWESAYPISVSKTRYTPRIIPAEQISGSSNVLVGWRAADIEALTEDQYKITFPDEDHFSLVNITTSTELLTAEPIPSDSFSNYLPITDGFRVSFDNIPLEITEWHYEPGSADGQRWFSGLGSGEAFFGGLSLGLEFEGVSPIGTGDYHTAEIRWGAVGSYIDGSGQWAGVDGVYDPGETYAVDPNKSNQKAFMYKDWGSGNYEGFFDVPFEAWDVQDPDDPRQLNIFLLDWSAIAGEYGVGQWDYSFVWQGEPFEYIWVMATDYDPTGTIYNPEAGGSDLMAEYENPSTIGTNAYYVMLLRQRSSRPFLSDAGIFTIIPSIPLSERDEYLFTTIFTDRLIPLDFTLSNNYPNPFNPTTTIDYGLPVESDIKIIIYNLLGQEVYRFSQNNVPAGPNSFKWHGRDGSGREVSTGIYFLKFFAGDFVQTRKMVLLK